MQAGIVLRDLLRTLRLAVNRPERRRKMERVLQLRTGAEFFDFARAEFGISQIPEEILAFLEFAAAQKPRTVVEIGVADGGNAFLLSHALPDVTLFIGIDLYVRNRYPLQAFAGEGREMFLINGGSTGIGTLNAIREKLGSRQIDLAFIDGSHTFEASARDFVEYSRMVRDGGLIAFHDIIPDKRDGLQPESERLTGKVPELWARLKAAYPSREFVQDRSQDGAGIGVITFSRSIPLPDLTPKPAVPAHA